MVRGRDIMTRVMTFAVDIQSGGTYHRVALAATFLTWLRAWTHAHRALVLWEDSGGEPHSRTAWRRGIVRPAAPYQGRSRAAEAAAARGLGQEG